MKKENALHFFKLSDNFLGKQLKLFIFQIWRIRRENSRAFTLGGTCDTFNVTVGRKKKFVIFMYFHFLRTNTTGRK